MKIDTNAVFCGMKPIADVASRLSGHSARPGSTARIDGQDRDSLEDSLELAALQLRTANSQQHCGRERDAPMPRSALDGSEQLLFGTLLASNKRGFVTAIR